jgi:glycosyltransferase involved in cell wall biosynthesis
MSDYHASIIVSVYKNINALRAIFYALFHQSDPNFEIIVSEDGNDTDVHDFVTAANGRQPIVHLTQEDDGFRKNKALNRAIAAARGDILIFIDGDCVPHKHHIASHRQCAAQGFACSGRRAELGPTLSQFILNKPEHIKIFENPLTFSLFALPALIDHSKNYEAGLYSPLLHRFSKHKDVSLLGCNFSCHKKDLIAVNGFNEAYTSPGIGEDSDIEWRLRENGIKVNNIKFMAPVYHLYHEHKFVASHANQTLLANTKQQRLVYCEHGIDQYLGQHAK